MFDVQFTYSQGAFGYRDTNSLIKFTLTKRQQSYADDKTHLTDKVVVSNNVKATSFYAHRFTFVIFLIIYKWWQPGSKAKADKVYMTEDFFTVCIHPC